MLSRSRLKKLVRLIWYFLRLFLGEEEEDGGGGESGGEVDQGGQRDRKEERKNEGVRTEKIGSHASTNSQYFIKG